MCICKLWQGVLVFALSAALLLHPPSAHSSDELKVWISALYSANLERLDVTIELDTFGQPDELEFDLLDNDSSEVLATFTADKDSGRKNSFSFELSDNTNIACELRLVSSVSLKNNIRKVEDRPEYCGPQGITAILEGQASWAPEEFLEGAEVSAELEGYRFTTQSVEDGEFRLHIRGNDPESFVTLLAVGFLENDMDDISHVTLQSLAGSLGDLANPAGDIAAKSDTPDWLEWLASLGRGLIANAYAQLSGAIGVTLNNVTTALVALFTDANAGVEPTPELVADLILDKDPQEVLALAAIVTWWPTLIRLSKWKAKSPPWRKSLQPPILRSSSRTYRRSSTNLRI